MVGCAALLAGCGTDRSPGAERQLEIRYPGCEIYKDYKVQEVNGDAYWMIRKADGAVIRVKMDGKQFVSEEVFFPANSQDR